MLHLLLVVIATITITISPIALGAFPERRLDCSAIKDEAPLEQYKDICPLIANWDDDKADELNIKPMKKWDYLEKCTCNLLHHPLVWESLMTHEIETIYYVTHKIIQIKDAEQAKNMDQLNMDGSMVTKNNILYENDIGDVMYFWDRFTALLLNTKPGDKSGSELSKKFTEIYTDTYYKPDEYKILFKGEGETMDFRQDLSGSCNQLFQSFGPFLVYLGNLKQLSENPRFTYRFVAYDENLYRLMVSLKMCQFLSLSGVVIKTPV